MKTLKIEIINPRAKNLLRELASLNLISIIPKRKTIAAAPKKENREKTAYEEISDICSRMNEFQRRHGISDDPISMEEIVADIKEYRAECNV